MDTSFHSLKIEHFEDYPDVLDASKWENHISVLLWQSEYSIHRMVCEFQHWLGFDQGCNGI